MNTKMRGQRIVEVPEIEGSLPCQYFGKNLCAGCVALEISVSGALKPLNRLNVGEYCGFRLHRN